MSTRTWAVKACLKTATSFLKLDRISFPNDLASDLTRYPAVVEKALYTVPKEGTSLIVVDHGLIVYLENSGSPRDSEQYESKSLLAFVRRYFLRKIDFACTVEMTILEMRMILAGDGKLSSEEFAKRRREIQSLFTERLESYLQSTTFKVYNWLARI
jgi:hypothetical protein